MTSRCPSLVFVFLALCLAPATASASFTCSTVVVRNDLDPVGFPFSNRFTDHMATNAAGDVAFTARALAARQRLYLYPMVGLAEVVAEGRGVAPAGATFKKRPFSDVSLNDAGDLVFLAGLESVGPALLVRRSGGPLTVGVLPGDAAPSGGVFTEILEVGRVSSPGQVTFLAETSLGAKHVFAHDVTSGVTTLAVAEGAAVTLPAGRFLCAIKHADLGDGGDIALKANSKTDCSDSLEVALDGIYHELGGTITQIALTTDPTPVPLTTYADVVGSPRVNASGDVAFVAKLDGVTRKRGLFLWNGITTTNEMLVNDAEPATGGTYKSLDAFDMANNGNRLVGSRFKGGVHKQAILDHGVTTELVVGKSIPPPADRFAPGAEYRSFGKKILAVSAAGDDVVFRAKLKDIVVPKGKSALIRCSR